VFYYRLKIIKTVGKFIMVGVCAKQIKDQANFFTNALSVCLCLSTGSIYANQTIVSGCGATNIVIGRSII